MVSNLIVASDRQAREISAEIDAIQHALSSEQVLKGLLEGLPQQVVEGVRRSLMTERRELTDTLSAYHSAKSGNIEPLKKRVANDLGSILVIARLAKGWSQKEMGRRLGLPEQQIQRYEVERYRSISLGSFLRFAHVLGVRTSGDLDRQIITSQMFLHELSASEAQKILKHARKNGWLKNDATTDENALNQLKRLVAEHIGDYGTPSLLRTGLNVGEHKDDWILLAWKAQVTRRARVIIDRLKVGYSSLDISWLMDLVRASALSDGPSRAVHLLEQHGIILIAENAVPGMKVDGAAFLVGNTPIIALTLLRDRLDNFWFTLLHEVAHVILHYRTGLGAGFFDDMEGTQLDEFEMEANAFASNMLIPEEVWSRSPARISKSIEPVIRFANQLGISPSIVFGRIRMERKNYSIFSDKIGQGEVRRQLMPGNKETSYAAK